MSVCRFCSTAQPAQRTADGVYWGMFWEKGRDTNYVGEEDWAAFSTGALGGFPICGKALGFQDVTLQLEGGGFLKVEAIEGNKSDDGSGWVITTEERFVIDTPPVVEGPFESFLFDSATCEVTFYEAEPGDKTCKHMIHQSHVTESFISRMAEYVRRRDKPPTA
eukprot:Hpha_TRINITY_DN11973_c0_g1::TRINITY_DN11973_c0_g1_i1::g.20718::m.20718